MVGTKAALRAVSSLDLGGLQKVRPLFLVWGTKMEWTEARTELLKKLWMDGYSGSSISALLGCVTRSAVIGKVHRLGLPRRDTQYRRPVDSKARHQRHKTRRQGGYAPDRRRFNGGQHGPRLALAHMSAHRRAEAAALAEMRMANQAGPDLAIPERELVATVNLEDHHCRWPYGDSPFKHCGKPRLKTEAGCHIGSYCEFHTQRSAQSMQPAYRGDNPNRYGFTTMRSEHQRVINTKNLAEFDKLEIA